MDSEQGKTLNWTGRITRLFVENGRLTLLLALTLLGWGLFAFATTPRQYNPRITAPAFELVVEFPGASRREVLEQVTRPLENVISDIPGVEDVYSVTTRGGRSVVRANFFVGEDPQAAKILLSDRIQSNLNLAPLGIQAPLIRSIDPDDVPVMTIALYGANTDPIALRKLGFRLRDRLRTVAGASNIEVIGGRRRELSIRFDPNRMARSGIALEDIERALQRSNVYMHSGQIKSPDRSLELEATGAVERPSDLENLVVVTGDFGQTRLREVATVREATREIEDYVRHMERTPTGPAEYDDVVLLSVAKLKDANISDVTQSVSAELERLRQDFLPDNVQARVIVNEGETATEEIRGLVINLVQAITIVIAILLFFLNVRAAILVAVSIPLTLLTVFGIAHLSGQSINRITLFALILSLGLLVDNATVVIENIVRWFRDRGAQDRDRARSLIVAAVSEVGPGLFMSTVTTVLAFIPMAFVTGMMGPYMGPIPFFVPAALIVSLFLSFSINPWLAAIILPVGTPDAASTAPHPLLQRVSALFRPLFDLGERIFQLYRRFLHNILSDRRLRLRVLMGILVLITLSAALPAVQLVRFRMLPKADRRQFFLFIDLPAGTPLAETLRVTRAYEQLLLAEPEIVMTQSFVGQPPILDFNGLFRGVSERVLPHQASIRVGLTHPDDRGETSAELVRGYRDDLLAARSQIANAETLRLKLVEDPPGPPVLSTLLVRVQGYDEDLLRSVATDLRPFVDSVSDVVDTDISVPEDTTTLQVRIDNARATRSRVDAIRIANALSTSYGGRVVGVYHNENNIEQEFITLRMDRRFRESPATLSELYIYNDLGIRVPLSDVARIVSVPTEKPIRRENRLSTVYLYGDMSGRSITYSAIDILSHLSDYRLPSGEAELEDFSLFGATYRLPDGREVQVSIGGEWELTLEVFRDLGLAMGVAVFLVYVVLVAQFSSFKEPLIIMSTIPLGLIGVLPGFMVLGWLGDIYFNATSMIGVIALAGIAVNNSIILLEYLNSLKGTGLGLEEALVQAGMTRFRPIMLTTATTMLGSLTIAGDPVWAGLAYAIVFGLGVSSVLTLIVFPALYQWLDGGEWES